MDNQKDLRWFVTGVGHTWTRRPTILVEQASTGAKGRVDDYTEEELAALSTRDWAMYRWTGERQIWTDEKRIIHDRSAVDEYAGRGLHSDPSLK